MVEKKPNNIIWNPKNSQTEGISIELSPLSDMNKILDQMEKQKDNTKTLEKIILSVELHQDLIHAVNDQNINDANRQFALIGVLGTPIVIDENLKGKKWLPVYKEDLIITYPNGAKITNDGKTTPYDTFRGYDLDNFSVDVPILLPLWKRILIWFSSKWFDIKWRLKYGSTHKRR